MQHIYDTAVVGGGIAGYAAALTAKTLLLDCLWLGEEGFGDKLRLAETVTDFPGFSGSGRDFAAALHAQAARENVVLTPARADGVYAAGEGYLITAGEKTFSARTVILATGVETRGTLEGERDFLGKGVSYCAVCDGALYRGKEIAVVLSSEKFAEEAEYLAKFAKKVTCFCLYRGKMPAADNLFVSGLRPLRVEGTARVERIVCDGGEVGVAGVFLLKDSVPPKALCGGLETDGVHAVVGRDLSTNLPGLFAAGDITGRPYRYAKAAGEGVVAAHSAKAYLFAK